MNRFVPMPVLLAKPIDPTIVLAVGIPVLILLLFLLVVVILFLVRNYERLALHALRRCYEGIAMFDTLEPGDVVLTYHTYHGLFTWCTQQTNCVTTSAADARTLLGRLFRFNLRWGILCAGGLFVLPLSILNYVLQRRAITAQEHRGGVGSHSDLPHPSATTTPTADTNPYAAAQSTEALRQPERRVSLFHQLIGWTAAGLCALFAVTAFTQLVQGHFDGATGGALIALLLGWLARDFVRQTEPN